MLNEWQEFLDYTGPMTYKADGKKDTICMLAPDTIRNITARDWIVGCFN